MIKKIKNASESLPPLSTFVSRKDKFDRWSEFSINYGLQPNGTTECSSKNITHYANVFEHAICTSFSLLATEKSSHSNVDCKKDDLNGQGTYVSIEDSC